MHAHALDKILGMERNLWIGREQFCDDLYLLLQ